MTNKILFLTLFFFFMNDNKEFIFDFSKDTDITTWRVVDDVVMGGRSNGNFYINKNGYGEFSGEISLKNNGGFSSLRHRFGTKDVSKFTKIIIRLKGDGNKYQFRIKDNVYHSYSYISTFSTNRSWQNIEIPFAEMYPAFRGRKLDMNNFSSDQIEEIAFLFGNKKEENFLLEIREIYLQ